MQTATAFWTSTLINPRFQYFGDDHEDIKPINRNCPVRMPTGKRCRCNCPPPPVCCPEDSAPQGTYMDTSGKKAILLGEMTTLTLLHGGVDVGGKDLCFEYVIGADNHWDFTYSGGADRDVCVTEEEPIRALYDYPVDSKITFKSLGVPGTLLSSGTVFRFTPPEPSDEEPCDEYALYAIAEEGNGICNAGDEMKLSGMARIYVWKCQYDFEEGATNFTAWHYHCEEGTGGAGCAWVAHTVYFSGNTRYKRCNGTIHGLSQFGRVTTTPNTNAGYNYSYGFSHRFEVDGNSQGGSTMASCSGLPPGYCSSDTGSWSTGSVVSIINCQMYVMDAGMVVASDDQDLMLALDPGDKCCD